MRLLVSFHLNSEAFGAHGERYSEACRILRSLAAAIEEHPSDLWPGLRYPVLDVDGNLVGEAMVAGASQSCKTAAELQEELDWAKVDLAIAADNERAGDDDEPGIANAGSLPELTEADRERMESLPADLVDRLWRESAQ